MKIRTKIRVFLMKHITLVDWYYSKKIANILIKHQLVDPNCNYVTYKRFKQLRKEDWL